MIKRDECLMCGRKDSRIKALEDVAYFAQLLIDSVVRYEDGDVTISNSYSAALQDSLMRYDEARRE